MSAYVTAILPLKISQLMLELNLPIKKCYLFVDVITTIISMHQHPAKYFVIFHRYLSSININLFQTAIISKQTKEHIPLFINQQKRVNFADLLTKFSHISESLENGLNYKIICYNPLGF